MEPSFSLYAHRQWILNIHYRRQVQRSTVEHDRRDLRRRGFWHVLELHHRRNRDMECKKDFVDWNYGPKALGTTLVEDRITLCHHPRNDMHDFGPYSG